MDARKPPYGCCMVLTAVTSKDLLTCTSTSVPSALRMCASYGGLESTLVSPRSTVPGPFLSAAALTFAAVSPLSACSVLPLTLCRPAGAPTGGPPCGVALAPELELCAAPATAERPSASAPSAAQVARVLRAVLNMVSSSDGRSVCDHLRGGD